VAESPRLRALLYYGASAAFTILVLAAIPAIHGFPLRVPIAYSGDGLFFTVLVRAIKEDGLLHATRIGAPFGSDIVDWPIGMWLPWGIMAALMAALDEPGTAINLYWFATVVASGLGATYALRRLRVPPVLAFVLGILYACQPYTFYRNVLHVNLAFPLVPLLALLCLRVAGTRPQDETRGERALTLAACAAQGFCYVYYSFFACLLLVIAAPIGWLRTGSARLARRAAAAVLLLALGTAITVLPSVVYWQRNGTNRDLAYKAPQETDLFGLKLRHLLAPIDDHPFPPLRALAVTIERAGFPGENENTQSKLASVGSLGLLALLLFAIGRAAGLLPPRDEELDGAAALTLATLFVSLVGGLASFFSVLVSPEIRAYNRIVVFVSFFSLLAVGTLLSRAGRTWPRLAWLGPRSRMLGAAALLVAGLLDEIPVAHLAQLRAGSDASFAEDRAFTREIEARLAPGSMVFQLPAMTIPVDRTTRPPMVYYDPGRAYLHSRTLRWSWGAIIGRTHDWQTGVASFPPAELVRTLAVAGFSGVWLDRYGYGGDYRRRYDLVERELASAAGQPLLASNGGRYSFVSLDQYRLQLEAELGSELLRRQRAQILRDLPLLRWREGCSEERAAANEWWRSCGAAAWFVLRNPRAGELQVTLSGRFRSAARPAGSLRVAGEGFKDEIPLGPQPFDYKRVLVLRGSQRLKVTLAHAGGSACSEGPGGPSCFEVGGLQADTRRLLKGVPVNEHGGAGRP
jgi:phosphoglycerol transferase